MVFSKEILINEMASLNSFQTMQHVMVTYVLPSLLLLFFGIIITSILVRIFTEQPNYWKTLIISALVGLFILIGTILGFIPFFLNLNL